MNLTFLDIFDSNFYLDLQYCNLCEKSHGSEIYHKDSRGFHIVRMYLVFPSYTASSLGLDCV